jgi:hypothetical protein
VVVYELPEIVVDEGRDAYRSALRRLVECRANDHWPGVASGVVPLRLPEWARRHEDEDADGLGLDFGEVE